MTAINDATQLLSILAMEDHPSSSSSQASHRVQVNESCLDLLLAEMVEHAFQRTLHTEEDREAVAAKLENLGYRVGLALAERYTKDKARPTDNLDVVKFVCKDLWLAVFRKQVDNLKTNHRGVYVLQDNAFKWFARMSTPAGGHDAARRATPYLWFPCGIVRGALANLGVACTVVAETTGLPQCTFQIKIHKV
jgi:hypothetical protein